MRGSIRPRAFVVVGVALATLAAACAQDKDSSTPGAAGAERVSITLDEFSVSPAKISVGAETPVTLAVTNSGQVPHSFGVEVGDRVFETPLLNGGGRADLELPAMAPGPYSAWCMVAGHREAGMTAVVNVGQQSIDEGTAAMGGHEGHGGGMTAQQMADAHQRVVAQFPAETEAQGNQLEESTVEDGARTFYLKAKEVEWEVSPGVFETAFTYDGQVPGPQLRVKEGERVRVVLENELSQPTALHLHGLTLPNGMDGVPGITQDAIMPGRYFVYEFDVTDPAGTYVYHSHFNSTEQVGRGLYGAFIVEPAEPSWDVEYTLFLSDGPLGFVLNGKSFPATAPLTAQQGDRVLIRLANDGELLHPMHLHGYHFKVIAQDGFQLDSPYMADTLVIAPGQRFDVLVEAAVPGVWALHCHILSHVEGPEGMYGMVTALIVQE